MFSQIKCIIFIENKSRNVLYVKLSFVDFFEIKKTEYAKNKGSIHISFAH